MPDKSVLLVEDEDNIALALEFLIGREGFGLTRVASGADALAALEAGRPDLVVLDVMLPGHSGYEVCERIRGDARRSGVKVLMMPAGGGEVERRKACALGADAFLRKPFDTRELTATIRSLLAD